MSQFFRPPPGRYDQFQGFLNTKSRRLPNNQKIILKRNITKVNENNGFYEEEEEEFCEPYYCENPIGLHPYIRVYAGDNGIIIDKENRRALCHECIRELYPHRFRHLLPPRPNPYFFKPAEEIDLPDLKLIDEELPPLPSLDEEYPQTRGWIVPYSLEEEWKRNPPNEWQLEQENLGFSPNLKSSETHDILKVFPEYKGPSVKEQMRSLLKQFGQSPPPKDGMPVIDCAKFWED